MANRSKRTPEKETKFLDVLSDTCNVREACIQSGIARRTVYEWRKADREFATQWDAAVEMGGDALEEEAVRRAREGVDEPVFYKGDVCGTVRKYSDTLLIFLLKGAKPKKYGERIDLSVSGELALSDRIAKARENSNPES